MSKRAGSWLRAGLFAFGLVIALVGWFIDRADDLDWVMATLEPEAFYAAQILDRIAAGPREIVVWREERGVDELFAHWPELPTEINFVGVGRSVASLSFGNEVKPDIGLRPMVNERQYVKEYAWTISEARITIEDELRSGLFAWGAVIFFAGLGLSALTGSLEFWNARDRG